MLKIFVSSTSRDLKEFREALLDEIGKALDGVGMEFFVPRGEGSQKDSIDYLKRCDVVIFLITSYYGSLMDACDLKESCKASECPMKSGEGHISFTHCEYKTTIAEDIHHQTYLIEKDWELIDYLKKIPKNEFDVEKVKELEIFKEIPRPLTEKYYKVSTYAAALRDEVSNEAYGRIEQIKIPETVNLVKKNLAEAIIEWHSERKLKFTDFCDRVDEFNELIENIEGKVEVYGVGGIGKTALIQIALLIQRLKGKEIITIGTRKSYASGSGYKGFKKYKDLQYRSESRIEINLYDIINALAKVLPDVDELIKKPKKKKKKKEIIDIISDFIITQENLIIFIDDFHLADKDVEELVKNVDNIVFSSRRNTHITRKEICIIGIGEKDRIELIDIFSEEAIPNKTKELIKQLTEGHPVSTELLVKNYQRINFDKLKDFELKNASENQVEDFYKRVIEEIFSSTPEALTLLKNLSIINTDLETNIERESVETSYDIPSVNKIFNELLDTGMLKKKEGKEGIYEFSFKHVQEALEGMAVKESHEKVVKYYEKKKEIRGENINDIVEILYHKAKSNPTKELVDEILEVKKKIQPVHYGFKRLIDVGEELKVFVEEGKNKAPILVVLGLLYLDLGRFEEAESAYKEALEIYKELAEKSPDAYLPDVAMTQNNLGVLYGDLGRFEEAESAYKEALEIRKELAEKSPDAYLPDLAQTQNNLGNLYRNLGRFADAERAYLEALEIYKELAEKSPDAYLPDFAMI